MKQTWVSSTVAQRLAAKTAAPNANGCHLCRLNKGARYGVIWVGGSGTPWRYAHRVAWEMDNGPVPAGMCVCHSCDVPACVNPAHLFLGTQADNVSDKMAKGRHNPGRTNRLHGSAHPSSKLTEKQVIAIRQRRAAGEGNNALAREYGVAPMLVSKIHNRKMWNHL